MQKQLTKHYLNYELLLGCFSQWK